MTGPSAPTPLRGGRSTSLADVFGLWVDLGDYHAKRGVWLHFPAARLLCPHGCVHEAFGPDDVADFTARITTDHARTCPGQTTKLTARHRPSPLPP